MMILVTGGSKSGKSSLAERFFDDFSGERFYLATMQPFGAHARAAIERHQRMREGKGFCTIERCTDLGGLVLPPGCGVLLECMGNLCANEMFREDGICDPVQPVLNGIARIRAVSSLFVIVTNEVGADGKAVYKDDAFPLSKNLRDKMQEAAIESYERGGEEVHFEYGGREKSSPEKESARRAKTSILKILQEKVEKIPGADKLSPADASAVLHHKSAQFTAVFNPFKGKDPVLGRVITGR